MVYIYSFIQHNGHVSPEKETSSITDITGRSNIRTVV